jgi:hypothetical protein
VRVLLTTLVVFLSFTFTACGGSGPSSSTTAGGPLTGNWQMSLVQEYPAPVTPLSVSGFLTQSNQTLAGSVEGPTITKTSGTVCGGTAQITGTVNGQTVAFTENLGGTTYNFTGTLSSDNQSMAGVYVGQGGACFAQPTTGTWSALLIPPLDGNFTGTLSGSSYMALLTGITPVAPITVSGSITQSSNAGGSNASLTGTITATGYPCFSTVSLSGTISGQNVYLNVFEYNGEPVGFLGVPSSPATAVPNAKGGVSLVDNNVGNGLQLGIYNGTSTVGPCPPLWNQTNLTYQTYDNAAAQFDFQ